MRAPRSLYAAFDRFPSAKGAATHIDVFARTLFAHTGPGLLYVLGDERLPAAQVEPDGSEIVRFGGAQHENLLERGVAFGRRLSSLLRTRGEALELAQFRDPWSGVAIIAHGGPARTVYELNGLPSIELPEHRPRIARQTVAKLRDAEEFCLRRADAVVTPSHVLARAAIERGADPARVRVIPNGAEPAPRGLPRPPDAPPGPYGLYFGALQPWQGVETLLRAMAELQDVCELVICASQHGRHAKPLRKLARRLGLDDAVWRFELTREQLAPWLAHAALTAAPLTDCPRNTVQGCAPLKLLESFAAGVPVVASDLPAVREIVTPGVDGILVAPDRPGTLARAIRLALDDPARLQALGAAGKETWQRRFTWEASAARLQEVLAA